MSEIKLVGIDTTTGKRKLAQSDDTTIPVSLSFSGLAKITVGITQPSTPSVGDLWVDTN